MKVRFIGNVTVRGVEYADGDIGTLLDQDAEDLVSRGGAEVIDVSTDTEKTPEKVQPEGKSAIGAMFKRSKKG